VESVDEHEATQRFLDYACQLTGARGGWYFSVTEEGGLDARPSACTPAGFGGDAVSQLHPMALVAQGEGTIQLARADAQGHAMVFVVPVFRPGRATECFIVVVPVELESNRKLAALSQILQLLAAFVGQWRGRFSDLLHTTESVSWQYFCTVLERAATADQSPASAHLVADGLANLLQARFVAIGFGRCETSCPVAAIAPFQQFDRDAELSRSLESALAEAVLEAPDSAGEMDLVCECRGTDAAQNLRQVLKSNHLWRGPLRGAQGRIVGACIVLFDAAPSARQRQTMSVALSASGPVLDLVRRNTTVVGTWSRRLRQAYDRRTVRGRVVLAASFVSLLLFLFAVPLPYRLTCPCDVQPLTRRFVVAPYEGRLEAAYVEPGDVVAAGQILARMDAADIRLEVAGLEADLQRAKKQRDSSLAARETAAAQIAFLEMERLKLRIDLLHERMNHLDIRSPTDGVVISGEPRKLQGARMTMGQTLLEVGPMGDMVLEVAVADGDIARAHVGSPVRFRLESAPLQTLHGELVRIHPRAEQREGRNVFVGQVRLSPDQEDLRPGMRGRAKLLAGHRPLFWILFHRAWENVLLRFGW
jgi:multidrug efflux pump subunit AcrA (membrane-fusion protein)